MKKFISMMIAAIMLISSLPAAVMAAETETVSVDISVSGIYQDVNHWENATYSYNVTDGVADSFGWISNGTYKFMYDPSTGQIKTCGRTVANDNNNRIFNFEDNKDSDTIVIPNHIGAFEAAGVQYDEKDIVMYSQNANYGLFRYNSSVNGKTVVIPEGVTEIPYSVFTQTDKTAYFYVILPSTIKTISANAFAQSSGGGIYYELILPEGLETIGSGAFSNCRFTTITIPKNVSVIEASTFFSARGLENITFEGEITSIGNTAFRETKALKTMTFNGKNAPQMGTNVFQGVSTPITVYYPANGVGYTDDSFTSAFPEGTVFEKMPGNPAAEDLYITGDNVVGSTLTAGYTYDDPLGREESGSTATWRRADDKDFTQNVVDIKTESVSASTPSTYVLTEADADKYIQFSVIPKNADAELNTGDEASVVYNEKIRMPQTVPTVTLTAPYNGYKAYVNTAVTLSADAVCDITTIEKVEFYVNDALYETAQSAPYSLTWTPSEPGDYTIYAKAYNALGESGVSDTVSVKIYSLNESIEPVWAEKWSYDFNEFTQEGIFDTNNEVTLPGDTPATIDFYRGTVQSAHGMFGRDDSDYCLAVNSTTAGGEAARIYLNIDNLDEPITNIVAEADVAFTTTNENRYIFSYRTTGPVNGLTFSADGKLGYYGADGFKNIKDSEGNDIPYDVNTWYHVAAKFNFTDQTITYYMEQDGEMKELVTFEPQNSTAFTKTSEVSMKGVVNSKNPGTVYYDNFVISQEQDSYVTSVLESPVSGSYLTGSEITFSGYAKDSRGNAIEKTEFYLNGSKIAETTDTEYSFTKSDIAPGQYELFAQSISSDGLVGYSKTVNVTVADYSLNTLYSDGMILQRNKPIKIAGDGVEGAVITASLNGDSASDTVENGRFEIMLPAQSASKSTELVISDANGVKTSFDTAIGEIILCNGQSNMAYSLAQFSSLKPLSDKDYDDIRLFKQDSEYTTQPKTNIPSGRWVYGTQEEAINFSGFGFGTGRKLYDALNQEVPVGLISAAIGGTNINTWVPNGTFTQDPDLAAINNGNTAYNAMVAPVTDFTIGHVLWYQGEANTHMTQSYEKALTKYIDSLREAWDDESIDFTIIQLPIYDYAKAYKTKLRSSTEVRAAEWNVSERLENVATVVSIDTGSAGGIHPNDKMPLVERAANAIHHFTDPENESIIYKSPSMASFTQDGNTMTLTFKDIAGGLSTKDGEAPRGFKIAGDDGVFVDVDAVLEDNKIIIDTSSVSGTPKVRYAWEDCPALDGDSSSLNLINSAGLPMAPFRTDYDRYQFKTVSEDGTLSDPVNFTPMVRKITASDIVDGSAVITVNARDYDDTIESVEVFVNDTSIGFASKTSDDEYTISYNAEPGEYSVYAIATDSMGTTSIKRDPSLGSNTVSPVKYSITLKEGTAQSMLSFTDLSGNPIENFGGSDGIKVTSQQTATLFIAAYTDGILTKCAVSSDTSISLTSEEIGSADTVKAYLLNTALKPLTGDIEISR
jgi:sialate O-acetylesterase